MLAIVGRQIASDLDDLQFERRAYDGMESYAQSKACDRMLTWAFARRLADSAVTVNAVLPGPTRSDGVEAFLKAMADKEGKPVDQLAAEFLKRFEGKRGNG